MICSPTRGKMCIRDSVLTDRRTGRALILPSLSLACFRRVFFSFAVAKVGTLFELTKYSAYFFCKYVHFHLKNLFLYVPTMRIFVWKSKKRIADNDYLVYKREKEYASKDGGNCTSYLKIQWYFEYRWYLYAREWPCFFSCVCSPFTEIGGEDGIVPVSYTHLDVYKRQCLGLAGMLIRSAFTSG